MPLKFQELAHVKTKKVEQLSRNMLQGSGRGMSPIIVEIEEAALLALSL